MKKFVLSGFLAACVLAVLATACSTAADAPSYNDRVYGIWYNAANGYTLKLNSNNSWSLEKQLGESSVAALGNSFTYDGSKSLAITINKLRTGTIEPITGVINIFSIDLGNDPPTAVIEEAQNPQLNVDAGEEGGTLSRVLSGNWTKTQ